MELLLAEIGEPTIEPLGRLISMVLFTQMAEVNTAEGLSIQAEDWNYLPKLRNFMVDSHHGILHIFGPAYKYMPLKEAQTGELVYGINPKLSYDSTLIAFIGPGKDKHLTLTVFDCRDNSLRKTDMVLSTLKVCTVRYLGPGTEKQSMLS
jgi:hypothetical protein